MDDDLRSQLSDLAEEHDLDLDLDEDEIEEVDLSDKGLSELPTVICSVPGVHGLYLEDNKLEGLPEKISQLAELEELYVRRNAMRELPEAIGGKFGAPWLDWVWVWRAELLQVEWG